MVEPVSQNMKSSQDGFRRQGEARGGLLVALGDAYECVLQLEYLYTHYYSDRKYVTNHLNPIVLHQCRLYGTGINVVALVSSYNLDKINAKLGTSTIN